MLCHSRYCIAWILLISSASHAADDREDLESLNVIGHTKSLQVLGDIPVKTEILTSEDILKIHANNLADAIRYMPGLQIKEIHGKSGTGVWMQGFNADRVLILIDGSPLAPSSGSAVDLTQIAIGDVARIEITKGAVSALYGASAMGGVINVITKKPAHKRQAKVELSGGSWANQNVKSSDFGKKTGRVEVSGVEDKGYWQLVADTRYSNGFKATDTGEATQGWVGHKANLSAKFKIDLTDNTRLKLMPRFYDENVSTVLDNFVPGIGNLPKNKIDKTRRSHIDVVVESEPDPETLLTARVMYEKFENAALQDVIATASIVEKERQSDLDISGAEFRLERVLGDYHALTTGLEFESGHMNVMLTSDEQTSVVEVDDKSNSSSQFYLQDSWLVADNLELMPGIRVHRSPDFGSYLSPMISLMHSSFSLLPGELTLRAGLGNGYRVPNLKEQYFVFDHSHLGYKVIGSPDLEPETSVSLQGGMEWISPNSTVVELSVFQHNTRNLIETSLDSVASAETGLSIYNYQNFSKTRSLGFEGVVRKQWFDNVTADLSYAYLRAKDLSTNLMLVKRPEHELKLGLDYQLTEQSSFVLKYNFQSKQFIDSENTKMSPSFATVDLKVNHTVNANWQLFAGVNNLTGVQRKFTGEDYRPIANRYVYAGIRFQKSKP